MSTARYFALPPHVAVLRVEDGKPRLLDTAFAPPWLDFGLLEITRNDWPVDALRAAWERLYAAQPLVMYDRPNSPPGNARQAPTSGIYAAVERACGSCFGMAWIDKNGADVGTCPHCHGTGTTIELERAEDVRYDKAENVYRYKSFALSDLEVRNNHNRTWAEFARMCGVDFLALDGDTVTKYEREG